MKMKIMYYYSHDEGVDAEGGVSHDVKEASSSCGCAWLCQNNLQEYHGVNICFWQITSKIIGKSARICANRLECFLGIFGLT